MEALERRGERGLVLGIEGEFDPAGCRFDCEVFGWTQLGRLFKLLKNNNIQQVVLAGGVVNRPDVTLFNIDFGTVLTLPRVLGSLLAGDDALLSKCIEIIESKGVRVIGAQDIAPELITPEGCVGGRAFPRNLRDGLAVGRQVLETLGPHDLGQACIVVGRRVVAVEGAEGTEGLLRRTADMRASGRLSDRYPSLLVKAAKPHQDLRVDLPSIGPKTVEQAHQAGLDAIAVEAGRSLILQRDEVVRGADAARMSVYGFASDDV